MTSVTSDRLETVAPLPRNVPVDADRVLSEEYEAFRTEVTRSVAGKLAASRIQFADLDMDGFYNQAWYGLYTKLQAGDEIDNRKGLLINMTYRRAIDEYRSLHPDRQAGAEPLEALGVEDTIDETLDRQTQFRQFVESMRSSLNERELKAATLCYVYGLSRPEAAEQVGVRPKRMEKIMDEVSRKMRPMLVHIKDGEWCEQRAELINLYALGALDEDSEEYREAVDHLANCSGCRRHVLGTRGMTAVSAPGAFLLLALTGTAVAGAAAGGAAASTGAGSSAGGGAGAAGGVGQAVAIAAAVGAVAVGGFLVAGQMSGDDEPVAGGGAPKSAAPAEPSANSSQKSSDSKAKSKPKAEKTEESAPAPAPEPAVAPPVEVAPAPEPEPEPAPEPEDAGTEFDLQ